MAVTLKQDEAVPASYPATPAGLSAAAAALPAPLIWQRIEAYISARWTARAVVWLAEGPGDWVPLLTPATINLVEQWSGTAWATATPDPSPLGGFCLDDATYRVTATVGSGTVPATVNAAFSRLAEYFGANSDDLGPGVTKGSTDLAELHLETERPATWLARALINSGAADLLRPYRRLS